MSQRILMFRAWDKKNKEWAYLILKNGGADVMQHIKGKYEDWQQYTGLFDKNGKEICRGDIVKKDDDIGDVIYVAENWGAWFVNWRTGIGVGQVLGAILPAEIIGNVHENPELLSDN